MRVLFVSKPVMPPWSDGSKNLVRDLVTHLRGVEPTVMASPGAPPLGPNVRQEAVYGEALRFAPSRNTLVLGRLLFGDPMDVWHFVFAPNALSSMAARGAIAAQRARGWTGHVVQTVASRPKHWDGVRALLFGDRIVALSEWTRSRLLAGGTPASRLQVIPPCAPRVEAPAAEVAEVRAALRLGDGPVVTYPGDLEVSTGAPTVAAAVPEILRRVPGARVVFACRPKTPRAAEVEASLRAELAPVAEYVRFAGTVRSMAALLGATDLVAFPVDDLYGKVDAPLVVLEAMALGKPVVVARGGPLEELGLPHVPPGDAEALADMVVRALQDGAAREQLGQEAHARWQARHTPEVMAAQYLQLYASLE